jgi:hypothetical protein
MGTEAGRDSVTPGWVVLRELAGITAALRLVPGDEGHFRAGMAPTGHALCVLNSRRHGSILRTAEIAATEVQARGDPTSAFETQQNVSSGDGDSQPADPGELFR